MTANTSELLSTGTAEDGQPCVKGCRSNRGSQSPAASRECVPNTARVFLYRAIIEIKIRISTNRGSRYCKRETTCSYLGSAFAPVIYGPFMSLGIGIVSGFFLRKSKRNKTHSNISCIRSNIGDCFGTAGQQHIVISS